MIRNRRLVAGVVAGFAAACLPCVALPAAAQDAGLDVLLEELDVLNAAKTAQAKELKALKAQVRQIEERLKKEGVLPLGIEGRQGGHWILMDYGEVIFHVFYEATREFYDIERLWAEAPSLSVEPSVQKIDALGEELA